MENQWTITKIEVKMSEPGWDCLTPRTVQLVNLSTKRVPHGIRVRKGSWEKVEPEDDVKNWKAFWERSEIRYPGREGGICSGEGGRGGRLVPPLKDECLGANFLISAWVLLETVTFLKYKTASHMALPHPPQRREHGSGQPIRVPFPRPHEWFEDGHVAQVCPA